MMTVLVTGDRIEREDLLFHRRVREGYLKIAAGDSNRIQIIEANQSADRIHQQIRDHFLQVYSKNH